MKIIDLRSDTLTRPTQAMRDAIARAEVGDDVFGEDPTVRKLEEMAAERLGKEAALFVASGTMGNLVSQLAHCGRGDEMILGDQSHIFFYEQGGSAALGGIHPKLVPNTPDGRIDLDHLETAVRGDDIHFPVSRLIALENTHNRCSGSPLPLDYMESAGRIAKKHGLCLHVDGARIFNAAVALGTDVKSLAGPADSVSFCLSKGLAAPVGSLVCGSADFIARARRMRKVLGGGMRQAGVLAAAGIVALTEMTERLSEDHDNARKLAETVSEMPGMSVNLDLIRTNIVFMDITAEDVSAQMLTDALGEQGVRVLPLGPKQIRAVTHYHISKTDIEAAADGFSKALKAVL